MATRSGLGKVHLSVGRLSVIFWIGVGLLYMLAYFPWNTRGIRYEKIDGSWHAFYNAYILEGSEQRFGKELAYTMGPLGFLRKGQYYPGNRGYQFIKAVVVLGAFFYLVGRIYRSIPPDIRWYWALMIAFLPFLAISVRFVQVWLLIAPLFFWSSLLAVEKKFTFKPLLFPMAVLSGSGLVVFSEVIQGGVASTLVGIDGLIKGNRRAICLPVVFLSMMIIWWIALGEGISYFPAWIRDGLAFSSGYTETMAATGPLWKPAGAIGVFALIQLGIVLRLTQRNSSWPWMTLLLGNAMFFFIFFKHSFVRQMANRCTQTSMMLFLMAGVSYLLIRRMSDRRHWTDFLPTLGALILGLCFSVSHRSFGDSSQRFWSQPFRQVSYLGEMLKGQGKDWDTLDEQYRSKALSRLPPSYKEKAQDWYGNRIGNLIASGIRPHTRPIFQNFAAYTEELTRRNEAFYRGAEAPEYLVFNSEGLNNFYVSNLDPRAYLAILSCYDMEDENSRPNILLLKKRTHCRQSIEGRVLSQPFELGQEIDLWSPNPGCVLWAKIDFDQSLANRLLSFAFRPRHTWMWASNGSWTRYRIAKPTASSGFIIAPNLNRTHEFATLMEGFRSGLYGRVDKVKFSLGDPSFLPGAQGGSFEVIEVCWAAKYVNQAKDEYNEGKHDESSTISQDQE